MTRPSSKRPRSRPLNLLSISTALMVVAGVAAAEISLVSSAQAGPYIPCEQWQQMHPGWPCIDVPEPPTPGPPTTPPPLPTPVIPGQPPTSNGGGTNAGALTPPPVGPGDGTPIIPVPGAPELPVPKPPTTAVGVPPATGTHGVPPPADQPQSPPPNGGPIAGGDGVIPPELIRPACGVPGIRVLSPAEVHEVVTLIVGPLEKELGPDDPFVRRVIDRTNQLNKGCSGTKEQIEQIVWQEVRDEWYRIYRDRNRTRDRNKQCAYTGDTSKDCEGVVAVCVAKGQENLPEPQRSNIYRQRDEYIVGSNAYIATNRFPAWRINTKDTPERAIASQLATQWKNARPEIFDNPDPAQFPSGKAEPGHVPDTTWTGPPPPKPNPYTWLAMDMSLNRSIGSQALTYPVNYKARAFVPGDWEGEGCVPSANPRIMSTPPPSSFGG